MNDTTFLDLDLAAPLLRALEKLGFATPTPVQSQVIPLALEGRDLLVSAATGSGKTAAFLLPMLQRFLDEPAPFTGTRGLVLVPTRELAQQTHAEFLKVGSYTRLTAGVITGGAPTSHQIATLRKNPDLLIATPGRLLEHLERGSADLSELEVLVLDEADRMLDMGFAPDVLSILGHCNPARQSMMFSATLHQRGLRKISDELLKEPETVTADPPRAQPQEIRQQVILADDPAHKLKLTAWLLANEQFERAAVFTNTREGAVKVGNALRAKGLRCGTLHGELEQRERNRVIGLLRGGQINVLVATDVAARGLDIPGLGLVINHDIARSGDDHLHRTGRTGRAGEQGLAVSLVGPQEWNLMSSIERYLRLAVERRAIDGLEANYQGPKKLKNSGKAAGKKKPKEGRKGSTAKAKPGKKGATAPKPKSPAARPAAPRRAPVSVSGTEGGHQPLRKRKE